MNTAEIEKAIEKTLNARQVHPTWQLTVPGISHSRAKMEFSKKLIIGASIFYGIMCVIALMSWFLFGEWPQEIIEHFSWPYAAVITGYMCKSAYENKPKIQRGYHNEC